MNISELTQDELSALRDGLALAAKLVGKTLPLSLEHVQELYDTLRDNKSDFPEGTIALGLSFGQLIADQSGYDWVRVSDEYGEETCLSPVGAQLICSPISMMQKRLSNSEVEDLGHLRDETIKIISSKIQSGEYQPR